MAQRGMPDSPQLTLYDHALVALRRIIRATDLQSKKLARETGLTLPQFMILQSLKDKDDATIGSIAQDINLTQATVTTIIDRMQARGIVTRHRNTADLRKVNVRMTDAGRDLLERGPATLQDRFGERFAALPDWERHGIVAALQRIAALMDAERIDAAPMLDIGPLDRSEEAADERQPGTGATK
jgi:DNA-binding MarR family transcriptional regulator